MKKEIYLNRDSAQKMLDTRPTGTTAEQALAELAKQGFKIEGYNDTAPIVKLGEGALNVGKSILGAITEPSARLGQTAGAATIAGVNTLKDGGNFSDNYQKATELYKKSGDVLGNAVYGESVQPDQNLKEVAADVGQTAVNFLPYGKIAGGVAAQTGSKLLGQVAAGGAGGYLVDVSSNLREDSTQPLSGEDFKPGLGTAIGVGTPLAFEGAKIVGRTAKKLGTKAVEAVLPRGVQEAGVVQAYRADTPFLERVSQVLSGTEKAPQTVGKTATENTLLGTKSMMGIQAKRAQEKIWKGFLQPALDNAGVEVNLPKYFDTIEQKIIADTPEMTRQKALLEALDSFRADYAGTSQVSLAKLQQLKEGWAEFVPEKFYKGQNIAGNAKQVSALLADEARQTIYNVLGPEAKTAYFDYGNLKALAELGKSEMTNQKLKGGSGSLISDLISRAVTPIGTLGGQVVYRLGQGLEIIGNAGANTLNEALGLNAVTQDLAKPITTEVIQNAKTIKNKVSSIKPSLPQNKKITSGKVIPKELQPLAEEAKKYKSAEDFIKGQGNEFYHGTTKGNSFSKFDMSKADTGVGTNINDQGNQIYLTTSKDAAKWFSKMAESKNQLSKGTMDFSKPEPYGDVLDFLIDKKAKVLKVAKMPRGEEEAAKLIGKIKSQGYDAVEFPDEGFNTIEGQMDVANLYKNGKPPSSVIVLNEKVLKSKQQLIDLWNKANGKK